MTSARNLQDLVFYQIHVIQILLLNIVISRTLNTLMNSSFWIDAINLECSMIEKSGHRLQFLNRITVFSLKIIFVLANSVYPDEMPHYAAFNLGLLCLQWTLTNE